MAHMAKESTSLNWAKLHSESKYLGRTPFMKENIDFVFPTFSAELYVVYEVIIPGYASVEA